MLSRWGHFIGVVADRKIYTVIAVAICVLVFATFELVIHRLLAESTVALALVDAGIVSSAAGLMLWILLNGISNRRELVRMELAQIAQLNHEIRNALQILMDSHYQTTEANRQMVFESIARIDAALQRLVPVLGPGVRRTSSARLRPARSRRHYS